MFNGECESSASLRREDSLLIISLGSIKCSFILSSSLRSIINLPFSSWFATRAGLLGITLQAKNSAILNSLVKSMRFAL